MLNFLHKLYFYTSQKFKPTLIHSYNKRQNLRDENIFLKSSGMKSLDLNPCFYKLNSDF
jgi:hypothetical protein